MNTPVQIKLDLEKKIVVDKGDEKKGDPLGFRATDGFRAKLEEMAKHKKITIAELLEAYAINGYTEDLKTQLLIEHSKNKTLAELL